MFLHCELNAYSLLLVVTLKLCRLDAFLLTRNFVLDWKNWFLCFGFHFKS